MTALLIRFVVALVPISVVLIYGINLVSANSRSALVVSGLVAMSARLKKRSRAPVGSQPVSWMIL